MDRGQSLIIPPLFDGTNYAYWKVRMRAFLQSLDEKVWQVVEIDWTKPKEAPTDQDLSLAKKKLNCLKMKMCKGVRLRRVKVKGITHIRELRES